MAEWVVACDQPFEEVERPEFRRLLEYTHMGSKPLDIPHQTSLKNRIMMMGKDTVEGIRNMVTVRNLSSNSGYPLSVCFRNSMRT